MSPILVSILEAVVPLLVHQAENLFPAPSSGNVKHAWVEGMVNDALDALAQKFNAPTWATPIIGEAEIYLKGLIEKEVEKLDPSPKPSA